MHERPSGTPYSFSGMSTSEDLVAAGAVWRSKRRTEQHRTVTIVGVDDGRVFVRRNTSRRRQAISRKTLAKDYRFDRWDTIPTP